MYGQSTGLSAAVALLFKDTTPSFRLNREANEDESSNSTLIGPVSSCVIDGSCRLQLKSSSEQIRGSALKASMINSGGSAVKSTKRVNLPDNATSV